MQPLKFSIICATNNTAILNSMLIPSLRSQTFRNFETLIVDTSKEVFASAAAALNYGASQATGEYLIFLHHDIEFSEDFIERLSVYCEQYSFGIAGVAGAADGNTHKVYSTVWHGPDRQIAGIENTSVCNIWSLDECLFIIKRDTFHKFEDYGNTWHFYAVEYSLRCHEADEPVLLFPLKLYHASTGFSLDGSYYDTLRKVGKRHPNFDKIRTTMGMFSNDWTLPLRCLIKKIKLKKESSTGDRWFL